MPLGVQYSGMWTLAQQFQAVGAGTWKGLIMGDYLWAWGQNSYGAEGKGLLGDDTEINKSSPIQIGTLNNWSSITTSAGGHSMALKTDGTMWLWGRGDYGQLGNGDTVTRSSPVQIGT